MTYNCPKCNIKFEKGTKFCQNCGCDLENEFIENPICPECKTKYSANTQFCVKDGSRLVSPGDLIPRCVICSQQYPEEINFCPKDGGEIKVILNRPRKQVRNYPTGSKSTRMFTNTFSFDGRIRRTEYAISVLIYAFIATIINGIIGASNGDAFILLVLFIPALWFIWAQGAKRCHDLGNSGWWQLIPFYGFWLLFQDGQIGKNEYGENPKGIN